MRRAIVTGGSRGIGRAIARSLLAAGASVVITGTDRERLDQTVALLAAELDDPDRLIGSVVDVRDRAGVDRLVTEAADRLGGLDTLVNNAGVGTFGDVASTTDEDWQRVVETNLSGPFFCARAAIPEMIRTGRGWIINIASLAARNPFPGGAAYCASKAALVAFSEALMQEVRFHDIRVSVVMPGSVATGFSGRSADDSWKLSPDDVAEVVMDLLRHPARSLPSRVEVRPSRPRRA